MNEQDTDAAPLPSLPPQKNRKKWNPWLCALLVLGLVVLVAVVLPDDKPKKPRKPVAGKVVKKKKAKKKKAVQPTAVAVAQPVVQPAPPVVQPAPVAQDNAPASTPAPAVSTGQPEVSESPAWIDPREIRRGMRLEYDGVAFRWYHQASNFAALVREKNDEGWKAYMDSIPVEDLGYLKKKKVDVLQVGRDVARVLADGEEWWVLTYFFSR